MLTVYSFPKGHGHPSLSPFCTKLLVHLTLAGVPYRATRGDPRKSPTSKLPCVDLDGEIVADSTVILERLGASHPEVDLDRHLDAEQRALGHLVRRTAEEHFYWALVHSRWITDEGWVHQRPVVGAVLPAPLRGILLPVLRGSVRKSLHGHGLGRLPRAQIEARAVADVEATEAVASEGGPWFFGSELSGTDVLIHAFHGAARSSPHPNPITEAVKKAPRLCRIIDGVESRYREAGGEDVD